MKKKKLFASLAIATAALFSLAACTNNGTATSNPDASKSIPAESTSTGASASTPAPSASTEATEVAVKIIAKYSDKANETLDTRNVNAGTTINRPNDTIKEGYEFVDYYANAALTTKFDFSQPITKATNIYAFYDNVATYKQIKAEAEAAGETFEIDERFNTITALEKATDYGTTARIVDGSKAGGTAAANISGLKAEIVPGGTDKGTLMVDFGGSQTTSIVRGYFEVEFTALQKDIFMEFHATGNKADGTSTTKYKVLRVGCDKSGKLRYKYNNDTDENNNFTYTFKANQIYHISYEIDTIAKNISIYSDTTKLFDYSYASETAITGGINGMVITNIKAADNDKVYVDNMLVNIVPFDLDDAKASAKDALQDEYNAYLAADKGNLGDDEFDMDVYATVTAALASGKDLIDTSTDPDTISTNKASASTALEAAVNTTRTTQKTAVRALINDTRFAQEQIDQATGYGETDPEGQLTALKTKYDALAASDSVVTLDDLRNLFEAYTDDVEDILAEKVELTVNYYEYGYNRQEITAFAEGVTYYTENSGEYTAVAADATFDSTKAYYTYGPVQVVDNSTPVTSTVRVVKDKSLAKYTFDACAGYKLVSGVYTDAAFTTILDNNKTYSAADNLYVIVTNTATWNCKDLVVTSADENKDYKNVDLILGVAETSGSVTLKLNGDKNASIGIELGKSSGGKVVITLDATAKVTFGLSSTGSGNNSADTKLQTKAGATVTTLVFNPAGTESTNTNGVLDIKKNTSSIATYTLDAGEYELLTAGSSRGVRVQYITIEYINNQA